MKQFSLAKITDLLSSHGYIIYRIFGRDGLCEYIEIVSMNWTDFFMIYAGDDISIPCTNFLEMEKIEEIVDEDDDNVIENTEIEEQVVQENYTDVTQRDIDLTNPNAEKQLQKTYHTSIDIKNKKELNYKQVAPYLRQLKRLNKCVEDIDYNLGIYTKQYFIVSRGSKIKSYFIKKADYADSSRILIVTPFENLVFNVENIYDNIIFIKNGIYRTLKKTHSNFIKSLEPLFDVGLFVNETLRNIHELEELLNEFSNFLEIAKKKSDHEDTKGDIANRILTNRTKYESLLLKLDEVLFENAVMMVRILGNFKSI